MDYTTVRGMFWDGEDLNETGSKVTYKFDKDGFKHAILRAFGDLTQRTMKRKDTSKSVSIKDLRDFVCDGKNYKNQQTFLCLLNEYFTTNNHSDYEKWHELACESIITCLDAYYKKKSVSYGKAQKIVNMTMKGIYCLKGADKYIEKFEPCHMALDSFTLEWLYRCCNSEKYKKEGFAQDTNRKNIPAWSNMAKKTKQLIDKNTKNNQKYSLLGYYDIQKKIASLVEKIQSEKKNDNPDFKITPFEIEFFVWPQMQITIAAEALYANITDDKKRIDDFKAKNIEEKYKLLQDLLNNSQCVKPCFI